MVKCPNSLRILKIKNGKLDADSMDKIYSSKCSMSPGLIRTILHGLYSKYICWRDNKVQISVTSLG